MKNKLRIACMLLVCALLLPAAYAQEENALLDQLLALDPEVNYITAEWDALEPIEPRMGKFGDCYFGVALKTMGMPDGKTSIEEALMEISKQEELVPEAERPVLAQAVNLAYGNYEAKLLSSSVEHRVSPLDQEEYRFLQREIYDVEISNLNKGETVRLLVYCSDGTDEGPACRVFRTDGSSQPVYASPADGVKPITLLNVLDSVKPDQSQRWPAEELRDGLYPVENLAGVLYEIPYGELMNHFGAPDGYPTEEGMLAALRDAAAQYGYGDSQSSLDRAFELMYEDYTVFLMDSYLEGMEGNFPDLGLGPVRTQRELYAFTIENHTSGEGMNLLVYMQGMNGEKDYFEVFTLQEYSLNS